MKLQIHKARINIKSLAAEAVFIRQEIKKIQDLRAKCSLYEHKVQVLKPEARLAQLAMAFMKGQPRVVAERSWKNPIDSVKLYAKLTRWSYRTTKEELDLWLKGGELLV